MKFRNLVTRSLIYAYPWSWRSEYGAELSDVLAQKPLTIGLIANVLTSGATQRLYRDEPWKICGAALLLWTCMGLALIGEPGLAPSVQLWYTAIPIPIRFATGVWTVLRKNAGPWAAALASSKAAAMCFLPGALAAILQGPILVPHSDGSMWHQWGVYFSFSQNISLGQYVRDLLLIVPTGSMLLGFAGAIAGRSIAGLRKGLRGNQVG